MSPLAYERFGLQSTAGSPAFAFTEADIDALFGCRVPPTPRWRVASNDAECERIVCYLAVSRHICS